MSSPVTINGDNFELTDALRELTVKKTKHLHTICKQISHIDITFKVDKLDQVVCGLIKVPGKELVAQASSDDMYKSVDLLIDKLSSQLRKYKEKLSGH